MNRPICLVSRCVSQNQKQSIFHFKGYYLGQKISEVVIYRPTGIFCPQFVVKEDYVLFLEILEIKNTILIANHLKSKHLSQINF